MSNDAELLRLCDLAAKAEGPCLYCNGPESAGEIRPPDGCPKCHGTGTVPLLKGVRVECDDDNHWVPDATNRILMHLPMPMGCAGWKPAPVDTVVCAAVDWLIERYGFWVPSPLTDGVGWRHAIIAAWLKAQAMEKGL